MPSGIDRMLVFIDVVIVEVIEIVVRYMNNQKELK